MNEVVKEPSPLEVLKAAIMSDTMLDQRRPFRPIPLPRWPQFQGKLFARILDPEQHFTVTRGVPGTDNHVMHPLNVAHTVVVGVCDKDGMPVFTTTDMERIKANGVGEFYSSLARAVYLVNDILEDREGFEALVKNLETTSV